MDEIQSEISDQDDNIPVEKALLREYIERLNTSLTTITSIVLKGTEQLFAQLEDYYARATVKGADLEQFVEEFDRDCFFLENAISNMSQRSISEPTKVLDEPVPVPDPLIALLRNYRKWIDENPMSIPELIEDIPDGVPTCFIEGHRLDINKLRSVHSMPDIRKPHAINPETMDAAIEQRIIEVTEEEKVNVRKGIAILKLAADF